MGAPAGIFTTETLRHRERKDRTSKDQETGNNELSTGGREIAAPDCRQKRLTTKTQRRFREGSSLLFVTLLLSSLCLCGGLVFQSIRRALTGSVEAARRAGSRLAAAAETASSAIDTAS